LYTGIDEARKISGLRVGFSLETGGIEHFTFPYLRCIL
jgi:hypothetical protein